jgi:hypothetical protein
MNFNAMGFCSPLGEARVGHSHSAIRDRIGDTVNDVEQPSKPITKKGSPARKEADKRPE